jgi:hypothetical protein
MYTMTVTTTHETATGVQINENACDGFIHDTSALDHSSQGAEMQSATSWLSRCICNELQNANKLKLIQLFYCYAIVSNAGLNCRSNAIVIILVIVCSRLLCCCLSWILGGRNPGRMGSSLPRKKRRLLRSAASLPDLIGSDPMRSGNEAGSLRAWSDKR